MKNFLMIVFGIALLTSISAFSATQEVAQKGAKPATDRKVAANQVGGACVSKSDAVGAKAMNCDKVSSAECSKAGHGVAGGQTTVK